MAVPGLCKAVKPALGFDDPAAEGSAPGEMSETGVLRMRFSEPVRMADDGEHSPVWARTKRRSGGKVTVIEFACAVPVAKADYVKKVRDYDGQSYDGQSRARLS